MICVGIREFIRTIVDGLVKEEDANNSKCIKAGNGMNTEREQTQILHYGKMFDSYSDLFIRTE